MKKVLIFATLLCVLVLAMTGCSKNAEPEATAAPTEAATEAPSRRLRSPLPRRPSPLPRRPSPLRSLPLNKPQRAKRIPVPLWDGGSLRSAAPPVKRRRREKPPDGARRAQTAPTYSSRVMSALRMRVAASTPT